MSVGRQDLCLEGIAVVSRAMCPSRDIWGGGRHAA